MGTMGHRGGQKCPPLFVRTLEGDKKLAPCRHGHSEKADCRESDTISRPARTIRIPGRPGRRPRPDEPYESVSLTSSWLCGNNHSRKSRCSDFGHISGVSPGNCGPQLFACWPSLSATPAEVPTDLNGDSDGVGGVVRRAVNVAIRA